MANLSYAAATTGSSSTGTVIDCNHPYFLSSSDHPGMILVTVTLSDHNYNQWSRSMKIALSSKLKLGFIDGTASKPNSTSNLLIYWNRCNDIVISWILNTVSVEICQSIMYMTSAVDIWNDLATRFSHTNVPKLFNLRKEIAYLNQGTLSVSAYFTKFRALNDELESLSELPKCLCGKCSCAINKKLSDFTKSVLLSQFLMELNDQFTVIRGHILMISPPPTLSEAYGILLQEEQQREKVPTVISENIAMAVKQYNDFGNRNSKSKKNQDSSAVVVCDFCQASGHTKDKCFCLHGYPEWHKLFGKPKPKPKSQSSRGYTQANNVATNKGSSKLSGNSVEGQESGNVANSTSSATGFSESQCQQIMQMIQAGFREFNHQPSI